MVIELKKEGRRTYLVGNTYPFKSRLRDAGCNWDDERKAWWTGKPAVAESLAKELAEADDSAKEDAPVTVIGKARYKDRVYFVRWAGLTRSQKYKFRLTTLDEKIDFWVDGDVCQWVKRYQDTRTLAGIRKFIADKKANGGDSGYDNREYCYHPCPVTGRKCCPENGPCHDCE